MATVLSTFDASHEECRHRVCIVCYGKGSRTLSETEIQTKQGFLIDGFDIENSNFTCFHVQHVFSVISCYSKSIKSQTF